MARHVRRIRAEKIIDDESSMDRPISMRGHVLRCNLYMVMASARWRWVPFTNFFPCRPFFTLRPPTPFLPAKP